MNTLRAILNLPAYQWDGNQSDYRDIIVAIFAALDVAGVDIYHYFGLPGEIRLVFSIRLIYRWPFDNLAGVALINGPGVVA